MTYNTHGIILKYRDIGEHERIYTVLTAEHGKIEGWAQGVRKPQSKLVAHLQPLYLCDFMFARGRRFDRIAQVRVVNRFPALWSDLEKMAHAMFVASLVDQVLRPGAKEHAVFELLYATLDVISSEQGEREISSARSMHGEEIPHYVRNDKSGHHGMATLFSLKLLKESGFAPELHHCVICKNTVEGLSKPFDAVRGGVICKDCFLSASQRAFPVSSLTLETLEMILASPLAPIEMPEMIARELGTIAREMVTAHFGEEPRSRMFLDSLARGLPQMAAV